MAGFFGFFDYTKPGKGVSKEDLDKTGIALYFDILVRRIWKMVILNVLFLIASIPAILISGAVSVFLFVMLQNAIGIPIDGAAASVIPSYMMVVLLLFTGSGSASAAMSYVLRKYVNDTHSWPWSDFIDNLKSNFLQGTLAYIINVFVICAMIISIMFYSFMMYGTVALLLRTVVIVVGVIFLMMQMYVYQIMAGFKLKLKDIYRNALLLTLGNLPWSVLAFAVTLVFVYLLNLIITNPFTVFLLLLIFYSLVVFTQIFMTNNVVKKYLQEPADEAQKHEEDSENAEG